MMFEKVKKIKKIKLKNMLVLIKNDFMSGILKNNNSLIQ